MVILERVASELKTDDIVTTFGAALIIGDDPFPFFVCPVSACSYSVYTVYTFQRARSKQNFPTTQMRTGERKQKRGGWSSI